MKVEELKLYNKYKHIDNPDIEFIFIGIDDEGDYWFLYENKNYNILFSSLEFYNFDPDKIVKDLNLEIGVYNSGEKYIKDYGWEICSKHFVETNLKPILKDKLKNIINR